MDWALTGTTIGLIIAICYLLDWLVSKKEEDKQKLSIIKWWSQLDDFNYGETVRKSNIFCNEMFNKIYGKRHLSRRCVGVSFCVSILSVFILTIVVPSISEIVYFYASVKNVNPVLFMITLAVIINSWIDYISLVETRLILRFASRVKPLMLPVLLFVDLFLTVVVFWLGSIVVGIGSSLFGSGGIAFLLYLNPNVVLYCATWEDAEASILFYSTFSTSVFFYLYCLSTLFFKLVKLSKTRIMVVLEKLEDSDNLFKALGGLLSAAVVFVKAVVEICQYLVQA